ncbi:hypothetical protein D9M72_494750 [compost metagenome]
MMLGRVDARAARRAHHQRAAQPSARAVPHARGVVDDVVDGRIDKTGELDLGYGPQAHRRHADRRADDAAFGQRRIHDPRRAEARLQAGGGAEHAAVDADVLAQQQYVGIALQRMAQCQVDRFDQIDFRHGQLALVVERRQGWSGASRAARDSAAPSPVAPAAPAAWRRTGSRTSPRDPAAAAPGRLPPPAPPAASRP